MITVHVRHYLTDAGLNYVKHTWIPSVAEIISQQVGYIAFTHDLKYDRDDCINVTVIFVDEDTLN